eukprot:1047284_1
MQTQLKCVFLFDKSYDDCFQNIDPFPFDELRSLQNEFFCANSIFESADNATSSPCPPLRTPPVGPPFPIIVRYKVLHKIVDILFQNRTVDGCCTALLVYLRALKKYRLLHSHGDGPIALRPWVNPASIRQPKMPDSRFRSYFPQSISSPSPIHPTSSPVQSLQLLANCQPRDPPHYSLRTRKSKSFYSESSSSSSSRAPSPFDNDFLPFTAATAAAPSANPKIKRPRASKVTGSGKRPGRITMNEYKVGQTVRIRPAKYHQPRVAQKLGRYFDSDATITEVPTYPRTWFGLKMPDCRELKVRTSAFYRPGIDSLQRIQPPRRKSVTPPPPSAPATKFRDTTGDSASPERFPGSLSVVKIEVPEPGMTGTCDRLVWRKRSESDSDGDFDPKEEEHCPKPISTLLPHSGDPGTNILPEIVSGTNILSESVTGTMIIPESEASTADNCMSPFRSSRGTSSMMASVPPFVLNA